MKHIFTIILVSTLLAACSGAFPIKEKTTLRFLQTHTPLSSIQDQTGKSSQSIVQSAVPNSEKTGNRRYPQPKFEGCESSSLDQAILFRVWEERTPKPVNAIYPVNPDTGKAICGYAPILYTDSSQVFLSPLRKNLVIFDFTDEKQTNGKLRRVNLIKWSETISHIEVKSRVTAVGFSQDERLLAFSTQDQQIGVEGKYQFTLIEFVLSKMELLAQKQLDFQPKLLGYTPAGSDLVVYGSLAGPTDQIKPQAHLVLLNEQDLTLLWEQPLPGILDGMTPPHDLEVDPIGHIWGSAVVFSHDHSKLYILPSEEDELITIDFSRRTMSNRPIRPAMSLLDRFLAFLGPTTAYAKGLNGTQKQAALSKDGKTLYVIEWTDSMTKDAKENWQYQHNTGGLRVIDLIHSLELNRLNIPATEMEMSADYGFLVTAWWDASRHQVQVVDPLSMKPIYETEGGYIYSTQTFGGEYITLVIIPGEKQSDVYLANLPSWGLKKAWSVPGNDSSIISK